MEYKLTYDKPTLYTKATSKLSLKQIYEQALKFKAILILLNTETLSYSPLNG
jgi:hypothetical protein